MMTVDEKIKVIFDNLVIITAAASSLNDMIHNPELEEALKQVREAMEDD